MRRPARQRASYQLGGPVVDGAMRFSVQLPSTSVFVALRLLLTPGNAVFVGLQKNDTPVRCCDQPIDEAFFEKWRTPHALVGVRDVEELRLYDNSIFLSFADGDRLVVDARGAEQVVLVGYVEQNG